MGLFRNDRRLPGAAVLALGVGAVLLSACGSSSTSSSGTTPTSATLTIMVTNDDGVGAPGINAAVQGLRTLPNTRVTVVAPLTNQSGTGQKTTSPTSGPLVTSKAKTASGYAAVAVHGFPADTVVWAVQDRGLGFRPDVVVSGINYGQNVGPLGELSGTVGAAREAVSFGIPAIAASQGIDNGLTPQFSEAVPFLERWITQHRAALIARTYGRTPPQANLNVPSCAGDRIRGQVVTVMAASGNAAQTTTVNCQSASTNYDDDLSAFALGFAVLTPLYPTSG
jgi:5'-nucleotidase